MFYYFPTHDNVTALNYGFVLHVAKAKTRLKLHRCTCWRNLYLYLIFSGCFLFSQIPHDPRRLICSHFCRELSFRVKLCNCISAGSCGRDALLQTASSKCHLASRLLLLFLPFTPSILSMWCLSVTSFFFPAWPRVAPSDSRVTREKKNPRSLPEILNSRKRREFVIVILPRLPPG